MFLRDYVPADNGTGTSGQGSAVENGSDDQTGENEEDASGDGDELLSASARIVHNGSLTLTDEDGVSHEYVTGGTGAGIYVWETNYLYLEGSPVFADNCITDPRYPGTGDDLKTNGQDAKAYADGRIRQDIYIVGFANDDDTKSITVTGALKSAAGSIYVWPEYERQYKNKQQFAVFDTRSGSSLIKKDSSNKDVVDLSDADLAATYAVFRNARDDKLTDCTGGYLTGHDGAKASYIYWGSGADLELWKVDGFGKPLAGATFTLYSSFSCGAADKVQEATSDDGKIDAKAAGKLVFRQVSGDALYLMENVVSESGGETQVTSGAPSGYAENKNIYRVTFDKAGAPVLWALDPTGKIKPDSGETETGSNGGSDDSEDTTNQNSSAETEELPAVEVDKDAHTWVRMTKQGEGDDARWVIADDSATRREVILRKADSAMNNGQINPLPGAEFVLYRLDGSVCAVTGATKAAGILLCDLLPAGTYTLVETKAPAGYETNAGKTFVVNVPSSADQPVSVEEKKVAA